MRKLIGFACEGETLAATLDEAPGTTGLLIVSGGNEIRSGAHRGMAMLAQRLAATGTPVFRYDRRGVGDSTGDNAGYLSAAPDLIAAITAFRDAAPHVTRLIGFGNCDAASTLALFGRSAGFAKVVLANPWIIEPIDDLPPAAAIRARYAERWRDPRSWYRMIRGDIDLRKLVRGVVKLTRTATVGEDGLAARVGDAIDAWRDRAVVLLAARDATALAFAARYHGGARVVRFDTASHSFAGAENGDALYAEIAAVIAG